MFRLCIHTRNLWIRKQVSWDTGTMVWPAVALCSDGPFLRDQSLKHAFPAAAVDCSPVTYNWLINLLVLNNEKREAKKAILFKESTRSDAIGRLSTGKKLKVTLLKSRFNINNLPGSVKFSTRIPIKRTSIPCWTYFSDGNPAIPNPFSGSSTIPEFHTFIILQRRLQKKHDQKGVSPSGHCTRS